MRQLALEVVSLKNSVEAVIKIFEIFVAGQSMRSEEKFPKNVES